MRKPVVNFLLFCFALFGSVSVFAATNVDAASHGLIDRLAGLVLQLAVILFSARVAGRLFEKIRMPAVLGEIIAGLVIGPYCLGSVPIPGFINGLFAPAVDFPVSIELYSFATVASIVLLFLVGLETDLNTFMRYSLAGTVVGLGGVVVSFLLGNIAAVLFSRMFFDLNLGFADPVPLFMGTVSTATSVGVTARILSEKRKMNKPEGVTILAGAVIDDVLGIIVLAIVFGIIKSGRVDIGTVSLVAVKAVAIWLGFTALGLFFAARISTFLKKFRSRSTIALMAFALAMLLSGVFEKSGLAMIIGAYIMGLSLSKTDLAFMIQDSLSILYQFFVPIFFCVMGMLVDLHVISNPDVILFGLCFTAVAVISKVLGCSVPALFLNFNPHGAMRVGLGMIPRGEVAMIMAGLGLASGILSQDAFSVIVIMTFLTTLITPPVLARALERDQKVLRKDVDVKDEHVDIVYTMPNVETARLIRQRVIRDFEQEGFYVHLMHHGDERVYQIRKEQIFITINIIYLNMTFTCQRKDKAFVQTLFYEALAEIETMMKRLQSLNDRRDIGKQIFSDEDNGRMKEHKEFLRSPLSLGTVSIALRAAGKTDVIEELLDLMVQNGRLAYDNKQNVLDDILEREDTMTTGMQDGIALPHAKTDGVSELISAVGLVKEGIDFDSLDGKKSCIFVLTLAPAASQEPYLEYLAQISKVLMNEENRNKILQCRTNAELYEFVTTSL